MVVNVDHSCPTCLGIGPCEVCGDSGIVRAPADQCTVKHTPCLDPETARQSLEDYNAGRYKYAADTVKHLRGENDVMYGAYSEWQMSREYSNLTRSQVCKEVAMEWAFEAGYKAGRAHK